MANKKIAILGATSHIAKGLISNISQGGRYDLVLFARNIEAVHDFLSLIGCRQSYDVRPIEEFGKAGYEVVINCIGITDPAKINSAGSSILEVAERYDNLAIGYLESNPGSLYVNFSSGVVYEGESSTENFYRIAKVGSEARHRASSKLNIVDLRVFAYFSRFIDLESKYFMTEIIRCLKDGNDFITDTVDMERDYIHPRDLFSLIERCIERGRLNDVYDVYSLSPARKSGILDYFKKEYGLNVVTRDDMRISSVTGSKPAYYSNDKKAREIGYYPKFTSLECITEEAVYLLKRKKMEGAI